MADIDYSIKNFYSNGIQSLNRYDVIISYPSILNNVNNDLIRHSFYTISLQERTPNVQSEELYGYKNNVITGIDYSNKLEIGSLLDANGEVFKFWSRWIDSILNVNNFVLKYKNEYSAPLMQVNLLNKLNEPVYTMYYTNVFPISIAPLQISYGNEDSASGSTLQVTLSFDYMYNKESRNNVNNSANNVTRVSNNQRSMDGRIVRNDTNPKPAVIYNGESKSNATPI